MPQVPIPSVPLDASGSPGFQAPGVQRFGDPRAGQIDQFGRSLTEVGATIASIAEDMQDEVDTSSAKESYTQFADFVNEKLSNPEGGYLYSVGKDAVGARREALMKELSQRVQDQSSGLQNERQRRKFNDAAARHMIGVRDRVYGHEAEQMRIWSIGQSKAMLEQSIENAIEAYFGRPVPGHEQDASDVAKAAEVRAMASGTPDENAALLVLPQGQEPKRNEFEQQKSSAVEEANHLADLQGLPKDSVVRKRMVRDKLGSLHAGIVGKMVSMGRSDEALRYLGNIKSGEIDPEALTSLTLSTRKASIDDDAGAYADSVIAAGVPQSQALAQIRKDVADKKITRQVGDEAGRRIEHHFDQRHQEKVREDADTLQRLEQYYVQTGKSFADLSSDEQADLEKRGLVGKAVELYDRVSTKMLAAAMRRDPRSGVNIEKDILTMRRMDFLIENAEAELSNISHGDAGKLPENKKAAEDLRASIDGLKKFRDGLRNNLIRTMIMDRSPPPSDAADAEPELTIEQIIQRNNEILQRLYPESRK